MADRTTPFTNFSFVAIGLFTKDMREECLIAIVKVFDSFWLNWSYWLVTGPIYPHYETLQTQYMKAKGSNILLIMQFAYRCGRGGTLAPLRLVRFLLR